MSKQKSNFIHEVVCIVTPFICALIFIGGVSTERHKAYEKNKHEYTITISPGDTLWCIAEKYKPSWYDTREYIYEIKQTNNLATSDLNVGDRLIIYTDKTPFYTMQGYYADGIVTTVGGDEWYYKLDDEFNNKDVAVKLYDNATEVYYDDIIINVKEML